MYSNGKFSLIYVSKVAQENEIGSVNRKNHNQCLMFWTKNLIYHCRLIQNDLQCKEQWNIFRSFLSMRAYIILTEHFWWKNILWILILSKLTIEITCNPLLLFYVHLIATYTLISYTDCAVSYIDYSYELCVILKCLGSEK